MHAQHPGYATRERILSSTIRTKGDALSALALVQALDGDGEVSDHLLASLRQFLQIG
jgi:hypothetical protein